MNGIDVFHAYANELQKNSVEVGKDESTCEIKDLTAYTPYNVCVAACHKESATAIAPIVMPIDVSPAFADYAYLDISESTEHDTGSGHLCSIPTCNMSHTLPAGMLFWFI